MRNYKATFFKVEKELDHKGKEVNRTYSALGSIIIDDSNVDDVNLTLMSKAYRHAGGKMLFADRVEIREVKI